MKTVPNRTTIILVLGALAALGPFSIDMYLPGFPAIAKDLGVDISRVGYSLTSYFVGISLGQLLYGPLIDRYGRKPPLLFGLGLYVVAALGCAWAASADWLIALRFLQAIGGCVGMVAGRAIVRDLFPAKDIANVFSSLILVMGVAPIIAPTIGGYVTAHLGWRSIFYVLAIIAALLMLLVGRVLPESKAADSSVSFLPKNVLNEWRLVLREPSFVVYALAGSISFAGMFAYISGSPFVFMEYFGLTETQYGWAFGLNAFGFILGSQINRFWLKKRSDAHITFRSAGFQLVVGSVLALGIVSGYFGAAATLVCIWLYLFWQGFISPNATALALMPFTKKVGSASALLGSLQMITGALISGVVSIAFNGTPQPMALAMFGSTLLAFVLLLSSKRRQSRPRFKTSYSAG